MLSPQQFKIDLNSRYYNRMADENEANKAKRIADDEDHTKGDAPVGYYNQPSSRIRQQALPGMEMSVEDHLDALSKATGTTAKIDSGKVSHRIALYEPRDGASWGHERSHMSYSNERPEEGSRDNADTIGVGHADAYHPGEIRMVRSNKTGDANAMLETAERLASEHGMAFPKHSWNRTPEGVRWSQKQMRKRGEQVW